MVLQRVSSHIPETIAGRRGLTAYARGALLILACLSTRPCLCDDEVPIPLDQQPYRVRIQLSFTSDTGMAPGQHAAVAKDLGEALERAVSGMWTTEILVDDTFAAAGLSALGRQAVAELHDSAPESDCDKLYRLVVTGSGAGLSISGREWDSATQQLGMIRDRECRDRHDLPAQMARLLRELFRPVALIEQTRKGPLTLRARGAALAPHDEDWHPLREGAVFEVFYRRLNKDRQVDRIQQVPWTYLAATDVQGGTSGCKVTSGLRGAVSARRRRIEAVALGIRRTSAVTRLHLVTPAPARRPLGGVEVELTMEQYPKEGDDAVVPIDSQYRFVSDRNGHVPISSANLPGGPPVWMFVRSGQNLLARVPFIPGIRDTETLELPDDSLRLEIEGQVAQLQSELVDTVARRSVLVALTRNRAKTHDWDKVDEHLKAIAAIPKASKFGTDLNAIRIPAVAAARKQKDKLLESRIGKLCSDLQELITAYLDEDKLKELREEIAELKTIAAEDAAAEAELKKPKPAPTVPVFVPPPVKTPEKKPPKEDKGF